MATKQVDMIAQVGEMLKRLNNGDWCTAKFERAVDKCEIEPEIAVSADAAIVLASAILAVAAELREINNSLAALAVTDKTFLSDGAGEA